MKYKIKPKLAFRKIAGEFFIVDTENSYLHKLNEVGSFIWECLMSEMDKDEIIKKILDEFEVDYSTAKTDLEEFIEELKEKKLIEE